MKRSSWHFKGKLSDFCKRLEIAKVTYGNITVKEFIDTQTSGKTKC